MRQCLVKVIMSAMPLEREIIVVHVVMRVMVNMDILQMVVMKVVVLDVMVIMVDDEILKQVIPVEVEVLKVVFGVDVE